MFAELDKQSAGVDGAGVKRSGGVVVIVRTGFRGRDAGGVFPGEISTDGAEGPDGDSVVETDQAVGVNGDEGDELSLSAGGAEGPVALVLSTGQ